MGSKPGNRLLIELRGILPSLSKAERSIAEVVLDQAYEIKHMTISDIAIKASVSEASVVKFCKKLGLEGFRELRTTLSDLDTETFMGLHEELDPTDSPEQVVQKVFGNSIQALQDTLAVLNMHDVFLASKYVANARKIDFYGVGGSGAVAIDGCHKLLRIGKNAVAHTDTHLQVMSASVLTPLDVGIGISHSGRTKSVIDALRAAKKAGAKTIGITNYRETEITKSCDICLYSCARGTPITGENAAARIAQLNLIDIIFVLVTLSCYDDAIMKLEKTMNVVRDKRY